MPSARGMRDRIARELDIDVPAEKSGESAGRRLTGALGSALKKSVVGIGVAAGAALSASLVKGWGRLTAIEDAQSKLAGLGHSAESVRTIMDNALAAVRGTAFGLDEAATVAASAVAAGIRPGQDLQRVLGLVGDTASIAGTSMGEMGAIFNKVAASNRLTLGEVNQLADRGVPILQMLADQFGVTAAEMSKMVSRGEVDFAAFANALETNIGGAALESGNTTRGAFANMGAAAGRFGAALLEGLFPLAKEVFGGITTLIDRATEVAKPWADAFSQFVLTQVVPAAKELLADVGELAERLREFFASAEGEQLKTETLDRLSSIFGTLSQAAKDVAPAIGGIVTSLGKAAGAVGVSTWQILLTTVDALARVAAAVLVPAIQALAGWIERNQSTVTALVAAYTAWRLVAIGITAVTRAQAIAVGAMAAVQRGAAIASKAWTAAQWLLNAALSANPIGLIIVAVAALVAGIILLWKNSETFRNIVTGALNAVATAARWLWENAIKPAWEGIKAAFEVVAAVVKWWWENVTKRAFDAVVAAAKWVWDRIKAYFGFWQGILSDVREWVTGAVDWVREKFNDVVDFIKKLPDRIRTAASGMWDGIKDAFRNALNWIIDKWNGLSFSMPAADLGPLGTIGGFTLSTPDIPRLAQGGIVPATPGGRLVQVAEAGQAEAIIPLDRLERMGIAAASAGPEVLELTLDLGEGIREVVRINLREHDRQMRRRVLAGTGRAR